MAVGSRQRLAAIFGSLTAVGGAFAIHHIVKKRSFGKSQEDVPLVDITRRMTMQGSVGRFDSVIKESRHLINKLQRDTGSPGLSISVAVNGETVWEEGFGFSDLENGVKCSPDSVMKIASISKPITMTMVAREWEAGKLDLDADVRQYVPYWPEKVWVDEKVRLTPRQLCSHLAGIRDYKPRATDKSTAHSTDSQDDFDFEEYYITEKYKNVKQSVSIFKDDPLVCKPGTEFHYTTHGFTLLAAALEGATRKKFNELMENLLKDLGLKNTYIEDPEKIRYNLSRHYIKGDNGVILNAPFTEVSFKIAGAGLLSTTNDLVKFGNIILYSYQRKSEPFGYLKPDTVQLLWTPIASTSVSWDTRGCYAMGWQIVPGHKNKYVGHTGGTVGASSALVISMDGNGAEDGALRGVVVAILCNLQGTSLGKMAVEIGDKFLKYS